MSARVVTIASGEDLVAALASLGEAWVAATGHVEGVELRVASESADPTRAIRGRLTLVSLLGPAGGPLGVSLARSTDRGLELVGGVLVRARSAGVTALVTPLTLRSDDATRPLEAPRPADATSARREIAPARARPPEEAPIASWTAVAEASEEAAEEAEIEPEGEPYPVAGDLVDHFSFGLCDVLTSDGERLKIRDLRGAGRIREVSIVALLVPPPTRRDGKRCFRLLRKP